MFDFRLVALVTLLGVGCMEYKVSGHDGISPEGGTDSDAQGDTDSTPVSTGSCEMGEWPAEEVGVGDSCSGEPEGGFTPVVEWEYGSGYNCMSLPVVGDLDGDGLPEVVVNVTDDFGFSGRIVALMGDGSGELWSSSSNDHGYGASPAIADLDGDGSPEVVAVREYENSLMAEGDYTAVLYDSEGTEVWESDHFVGLDFDYATSPVISDMDHDGSPEIVVGRVILNADGSTRGVGEYGRGSWAVEEFFGYVISEATIPAVSDLDLDGQEEVIVGNAIYTADGEALWFDTSMDDGMIAVANLDSDAEGEFIASTSNTVRAVDTDGTVIWGPQTIPSANIVSVAGVADLDLDGEAEIVVAGGNNIWALNADGSTLWSATATDMSGATGASIFDFEGDGAPEVVYIDEKVMMALNGATGETKFFSTEHASATMFDYPVIADVDGDDHAEIVVCHDGYGTAVSVYGDADDSWAPARKVWNQHAYSISNISDDLSVPVTATPNFTDSNTYHSALATTGESLVADYESEILEVCTDDCDEGSVWVAVHLNNLSVDDQASGVHLALYALFGEELEVVATTTTTDALVSGWSSDAIYMEVDAADVEGADALWLEADDDGTGTGEIDECSEENNEFYWAGPFCE